MHPIPAATTGCVIKEKQVVQKYGSRLFRARKPLQHQ